jgi:diaminohydroxyphosphoribosylaminopyrimidine deaminase / 5-amino-6-(5-phosphoribosylamino)uracil reductase
VAEPLSAPLDAIRIREALALAETSVGLTDPNPRVGCVIGREDGTVLGRGATQQAGGAHAEVMALRDAAAQGAELRGATAWVTLEPCAHHGRTPPCCDALVAAGLGRVVVAVGDPFAQVDGAGIARLRAAGVQVDMAPRELAEQARALNIGFFSRVQRGRPWVRLKAAASLDGTTALANGQSQWITGEAARADGHAWRRRAAAVLTGIGTVRADDPRLDVRLVPSPGQPARLVLDSRWQLPPSARLLDAPGTVHVFGVGEPPDAAAQALRARGARLHTLPPRAGRVDLDSLMPALAALGVNELHVEAGATLSGALLRAGWVDELLLYLAPLLLGAGRPLLVGEPLMRLADGVALQALRSDAVGADLRLRALTAPGAAFSGGALP